MTEESAGPAGAGGVPAAPEAIAGMRLVDLPVHRDARGALSFAQVPDQLPFTPLRYFLLFDLRRQVERGAHAHRRLEQFLVCVHGSCRVALDDGTHRHEVALETPARGLYVPPLVWTVLVPSTTEAVVLVLASDRYDAADYISDYDEFRRARGLPSG